MPQKHVHDPMFFPRSGEIWPFFFIVLRATRVERILTISVFVFIRTLVDIPVSSCTSRVSSHWRWVRKQSAGKESKGTARVEWRRRRRPVDVKTPENSRTRRSVLDTCGTGVRSNKCPFYVTPRPSHVLECRRRSLSRCHHTIKSDYVYNNNNVYRIITIIIQ